MGSRYGTSTFFLIFYKSSGIELYDWIISNKIFVNEIFWEVTYLIMPQYSYQEIT